MGEWLHHALETYHAPKGVAAAALRPIFKDREEEAAGHSIDAAIEAAMGASEFLIVLCSPNSAQSTWVNREVAWFKIHRDPLKILTVVVGGEPMASLIPGREADECFPKTLLYKVAPDLQPTDQLEDAPLAADARDAGDGKRAAKLKLAAAMLGVGLDTLVNRDNRRRAERRRLVTAGLASLSVVLGGLSVFAFNQRDAAVASRKDAEFQRDEAQSLVEFMLTDLRSRLDAVGRLDILDAVGKRLNESYAKQDLAKLDADALGRRARVQLLLGEVDNTRGNLDAALAQYKEAATTTEELLNRNPGKAQQIFDHAQSVFWVGYIAWQRGDAAEAKKYFTQYKDYADQLVAIDPENEDWQMEVNYANSNLGTLAMDQGDAAEAEAFFRKSLVIAKSLYSSAPENVDRLISLGQSLSWLADALYRQARADEAQKARLTESALYKSKLNSLPQHAELEQRLQTANSMLSLNAIALNEVRQAEAYASDAVESAYSLLAESEESADRIEQAAIALAGLADTQIRLGKLDSAHALLEKSIALGSTLQLREASIPLWRSRAIAQPRILLATLYEADGDRDHALIQYDVALSDLKADLDSGKADTIATRRYCVALAGRARLDTQHAGDWTEIISILAPNESKLGPEALTILAEAYQRTDKVSNAAAVTARLFAASYRHPDFLAMLDEYPALKAAAISAPQRP